MRSPARSPNSSCRTSWNAASRLSTCLTVFLNVGGNAISSVVPSNDVGVALSMSARRTACLRWPRCWITDPHDRRSIATSTLAASAACGTGSWVPASATEASGTGSAAGTSSTTETVSGFVAAFFEDGRGFGAGSATGSGTASAAGATAPAVTLARRSSRSRRATTPAGVGSVSGAQARTRASSRVSRGDVVQRMSVCAASSSSSTRESSPGVNLSACARNAA